ncbi:unnamed protein product [Strongylus vulgaris]|uniref:G-protein coupled receptors family 1 profile domain-containing protein n=1 Tax=Strongylus vulgaris TaxID=40348 RepID=A0A3P7L5U6_STRVU|nr:unnamed protein product [Strongylus vulgaris]
MRQPKTSLVTVKLPISCPLLFEDLQFDARFDIILSSDEMLAFQMTDVLSHCLTEREMMLAVNGVERVFIGTVVPVLIIFGISGNILNLTVLLTPTMRTR